MRVLVIAEAANPEWVSVPLIGWSLSHALGVEVSVHLVTQLRNRAALLRAGLVEGVDFTAIDSEKFAAPLGNLGERLSGGKGVGWTARSFASSLGYYYFEYLVWKQFGAAIRGRQFDVVHRITPLSPTAPSILARRCAAAGVPFVLGPLNGGVPWPKEFSYARRKEKEWLSYVRGAYKLLPGYRDTLKFSAAIMAGSLSTLRDIPGRFRDKVVYLPENAIDPARFSARATPHSSGPVRACFVGRLVPYKGPDMLLEAVVDLVRAGKLVVDILGDGPLMPELQSFVARHDLAGGVTLRGWVPHQALEPIMRQSQLLLFPSIREFGGGVVLECMAMGIVPVVVDYAGPAELVNEAVGFKVPLGSRDEIVQELRKIVTAICNDPDQIKPKSDAGHAYVQRLFTWRAKASQVAGVYRWVLGSGVAKPRYFDVGAQEVG